MNRSLSHAVRLLPLLLLALLAGCVVVPEGGPGYGYGGGYYAPAPVYIAPAYPGYGYGYRPHYSRSNERGGWR